MSFYPLLKLTAQIPDISIGLAVLKPKRDVKIIQKDHQKLMEIQQHGENQKTITIENRITLKTRLIALLLGPGILVVFFWAIFIIENEGLSPQSDFIVVLGECFLKILTQGSTECLPDPGYIILCIVLFGPFAFFITYKIRQDLKTKIILTDQKIIKRQPSGKEICLCWNEIKRVQIISAKDCTQMVFTRNERSALFDNNNRIFCPPGHSKEKSFISRDAANLILKKIDRYKISIKGNRAILEEIINPPYNPVHEPARPTAQNFTTRNQPVRPSPTKRPTLK